MVGDRAGDWGGGAAAAVAAVGAERQGGISAFAGHGAALRAVRGDSVHRRGDAVVRGYRAHAVRFGQVSGARRRACAAHGGGGVFLVFGAGVLQRQRDPGARAVCDEGHAHADADDVSCGAFEFFAEPVFRAGGPEDFRGAVSVGVGVGRQAGIWKRYFQRDGIAGDAARERHHSGGNDQHGVADVGAGPGVAA